MEFMMIGNEISYPAGDITCVGEWEEYGGAQPSFFDNIGNGTLWVWWLVL
jgi:hypothetical protein